MPKPKDNDIWKKEKKKDFEYLIWLKELSGSQFDG